jgi:hypothetical protein
MDRGVGFMLRLPVVRAGDRCVTQGCHRRNEGAESAEGVARASAPAVADSTERWGRQRAVNKGPGLREDLDRLVDPVTRGDPESRLRWICKSIRMLAEELGLATVMQSVIKPCRNCFTRWITVCRPTPHACERI